MFGKYITVGLVHSVFVALILKVLNFILPSSATCYYRYAANFFTFLIITRATFGITKKKFLNGKIPPDNRAVLITGCGSGIGNALAKQLDKKGYHVFASCRTPTGSGANELKSHCSERLQILGLDVTKNDSVMKALDFVKDNLGTSELWAIVNNAGVIKGFSVELTNVQAFQECIDVNTIGPVRVTKAFLPLLRQSRGRVVNISSILGRIGIPHLAPYTMSKFAAVGFSECLRQEMEVWGIRVISIEPECFATSLTSTGNLTKLVDETVNTIDEDLKSVYGEKYLNGFRLLLERGSDIPSSKVYKVVNAIESAISLENPDSVYRPCRNFVVGIGFHILKLLPNVLRDLIIISLYYVFRFQKPKAVDNNL